MSGGVANQFELARGPTALIRRRGHAANLEEGSYGSKEALAAIWSGLGGHDPYAVATDRGMDVNAGTDGLPEHCAGKR